MKWDGKKTTSFLALTTPKSIHSSFCEFRNSTPLSPTSFSIPQFLAPQNSTNPSHPSQATPTPSSSSQSSKSPTRSPTSTPLPNRQVSPSPFPHRLIPNPPFQLTTETTTCTPRAVQEQLKKLRKMAQAGSTTPSTDNKQSTPTPTKSTTASRKGAGTGAGVKKSRKPAAAGGRKGRKKGGKSAPVAGMDRIFRHTGFPETNGVSRRRRRR